MATLFQTGTSFDDILTYIEANPDAHFDIMDGEIVAVSPKPFHGRLQIALGSMLYNWLQRNPIGYAHTEVLHRLEGKPLIPDISVNAEKADDEAYFDVPPLVAVEIRSDTQTRVAQRRKAADYIAVGTSAVLLVMPGEGIELHTPENSDEPHIAEVGDVVHDIPGFPGFTIDVAALFA